MHRQTVALLAGVAGVVLGTLAITDANARIINVPGDAKKIQKAIDTAQSGDTVLVAAGKYRENIDFSGKDIYLSSLEGLEETTIEGRRRGQPVITISDFPGLRSAVRGFTVNSKSAQPAVLCSNSRPAILYNRISRTKGEEDRGAAIMIDGPRSGPRIVSNLFNLNRGPAIGGEGLGSVVIDSNAFVSNSTAIGAAMLITHADSVSASFNLIYRNTTYECATIGLEDVSYVFFDHNTIFANSSGYCATLDLVNCAHALITNCIIGYDLSDYGIHWEGDGRIITEYNNVWGNAVGSYSGFDPGITNISENPLLCNTGEIDFGLSQGSPCVGTGRDGTNIGALGVGCEAYPNPDDFVEVEERPETIHFEEPRFPHQAKERGMSGAVWVKALIDGEGRVRQAVIARSSGTQVGFEMAALEAAYKNRYKPAMQKGTPVPVWVTYKVQFTFRR